jgi:hypothetical protein
MTILTRVANPRQRMPSQPMVPPMVLLPGRMRGRLVRVRSLGGGGFWRI